MRWGQRHGGREILPVDIVWAIDTSGSMVSAFPAIQQALTRFSAQMDAAGIDAHIVLLAGSRTSHRSVAIRIGHLENSALRARRIGLFGRVFVASKGYLNKRGEPKTPEDLRQHDCVIYTSLATGATWRFRDREIAVTGRIRVNSAEAAQQLVNAGLGIGQGPEWLYAEGLRSGRLKVLLREYAAPPAPVQILYVANRLLPKRATVFMDYIAEAFSRISALNTGSRLPRHSADDLHK